LHEPWGILCRLHFRFKHALAEFRLPAARISFCPTFRRCFVEARIGLVVSRAGDAARARIEEDEKTTRLLAEVWDQ
jgi:hypothetical protein